MCVYLTRLHRAEGAGGRVTVERVLHRTGFALDFHICHPVEEHSRVVSLGEYFNNSVELSQARLCLLKLEEDNLCWFSLNATFTSWIKCIVHCKVYKSCLRYIFNIHVAHIVGHYYPLFALKAAHWTLMSRYGWEMAM